MFRDFLIAVSATLLLTASVAIASPEIPGAPQKQPIAIIGAVVHPISRPAITDATVLFDKGAIVAVGRGVKVPAGAKTIDAEGSHVYPGLMNTDGSLGLIEINAVRASDDTGEVGRLNMNVRAEKAVNPDSELIPVTRSGGVLFNLTAPDSGLIMGTSAILQLDGWTTEDLTLKAPAAMHIRWPRLAEPEHDDDHEEHADPLHQLEEVMTRARAYQRGKQANPSQPVDLRMEAVLGVLDRKIPVVAVASRASQIQSAAAFAGRQNIRLIVYGGHDAEQCAGLLKAQDIPVIINGVYRLPLRRHEPYDLPYTLPARLQKAGVKFCIAGSARFDASNIRNLPYHAAMATAFGLDTQDALRAITLWPAQILGVDAMVGSLEKGKHASLLIADGDIFDTSTNVTHAWIQGRQVDLSDRHKRLYRKYEIRQKRLARE